MTLTDLAKRFERVAADGSPAILSGVAIAGLVGTAVLAAKAGMKTPARILENTPFDNQRGPKPRLSKKETVMVTWKLYLPAAGTAAITVVAIVAASRIGTRRAAAMAVAYSISEKAFLEYREKVSEKLGASKERGIQDEIAQDRVNREPVTTREIIITGDGDVLCHDGITGRYFESSMEKLRKAQNDINERILHDHYASLSDFYDLIGLPATEYSNEVGWNLDQMLDLSFSATLADGKPCMQITFFKALPIRSYFSL